jgi:hypothetical protein
MWVLECCVAHCFCKAASARGGPSRCFNSLQIALCVCLLRNRGPFPASLFCLTTSRRQDSGNKPYLLLFQAPFRCLRNQTLPTPLPYSIRFPDQLHPLHYNASFASRKSLLFPTQFGALPVNTTFTTAIALMDACSRKSVMLVSIPASSTREAAASAAPCAPPGAAAGRMLISKNS